MLKKIISSIMFAAALSSFSLLADEFELMREERIGDLRIDLSEGEAKKASVTSCVGSYAEALTL